MIIRFNKTKTLLVLFLFCSLAINSWGNEFKSIKDFGVLPENSPKVNKQNLQKAIDWASNSGAALFVEPSDIPYPIDGGIILRKNVSLIGVHGPVGRGTVHAGEKKPVGSIFCITDQENAFIWVQSATQIKGIQFWYPEQSYTQASKIIKYKPTIQMCPDVSVQGVTLSNLTFYGEYMAIDFSASSRNTCELILVEHCYGYPLSGQFIRIDYCYDIPRILHCHVNPSNMREFGCSFRKEVIDAVVATNNFSYYINHTDNAQLMDIFTFGVYGGIYLGQESYGQLTNFNLDCVTIGIYKSGSNSKNRNWQIAQGSIIANVGKSVTDIHPIVIEGQGHTSISNVEAFSGKNNALTTQGSSYDYLFIKGDNIATISLFGCRMRNYVQESPITVQNPKARLQAVACIDKNEKFYNKIIK